MHKHQSKTRVRWLAGKENGEREKKKLEQMEDIQLA